MIFQRWQSHSLNVDDEFIISTNDLYLFYLLGCCHKDFYSERNFQDPHLMSEQPLWIQFNVGTAPVDPHLMSEQPPSIHI